jgi:GT2 family glycosyltransferase
VPYAVDYVPGTAVLVRSDLLRRLGGFDPEYFFSGEMADLCARARQAGQASFVVPTARARHDLVAAAELRDALYPYYSLRNRFLYTRRHASGWRKLVAPMMWALRGVARALMALAAGRRRRARALWLAVADGLRGRLGPADDRVQP